MIVERDINWSKFSDNLPQLSRFQDALAGVPFTFYPFDGDAMMVAELPDNPSDGTVHLLASSSADFNKFHEDKFIKTLLGFLVSHPDVSNRLVYDPVRDVVIYDIGKNTPYADFRVVPVDFQVQCLVRSASGKLYRVYSGTGFGTSLFLLQHTSIYRINPEKADKIPVKESLYLTIDLLSDYFDIKKPQYQMLVDAASYVKPSATVQRYPDRLLTSYAKFLDKNCKQGINQGLVKTKGPLSAFSEEDVAVTREIDFNGTVNLSELKNVIIPKSTYYTWVEMDVDVKDVAYIDITNGDMVVHYTNLPGPVIIRLNELLGTTEFRMQKETEELP